jgi:hypothetical protein
MRAKILQIIPADGWHAIHKDGDNKHISRLISWALCESEGGGTYVNGVEVDDKGVDGLSTSFSSFERYVHDSELKPKKG